MHEPVALSNFQFPNMEHHLSSSSSSFPNSQTISNGEHDVFLSFCGEDTGYGFADHLYHALNQRGFSVFRDFEKLQTEDMFNTSNSAVEEIISKSKSAVIVYSANYAASSRCLHELSYIVKCKHLWESKVVPFLYRISRNEIMDQMCDYTGDFSSSLSKFMDRCRSFDYTLSALTRDRRESLAIQLIVDEISHLLNSSNGELVGMGGELVGMRERMMRIRYLLRPTSNEVLTIGIWGMGGIGKTTLAIQVFKEFQKLFHLGGLVSGVRLVSAVELQKRLCESLLGNGSGENIDTVEKGIKLLKRALFKQKVLIILDDVDDFKQIECLAPGGPLGENIWGGGSRLIITTRDRSSLRYLNVKELIEVEKLSDEEASQLLCQEAFKNDTPPEQFVELSTSFLQYADGIPLVHKVLGSYLSTQKVGEWSHILHILDNSLDNDIFAVLRTSFDRLQNTDKKIFLDIACFFNGEDYVRVKNILGACGFSSGIGMDNLIDKSLIKVEENKLWMHGLLRCLGRQIVCKESPFPGERSRLWVENNAHKHKDLWCSEDACKVLMDNTGTAAVEGLFLSLPERTEMSLKADPFLKMRKLRLLKIRNVNFVGVQLGHLSSNLRILEWHECPLQFLPHNVKWLNLVEIKMPNSKIKQLWNGKLSLGMLTLIDLSCCQYLTTTPDFTNVPNLESLILEGCNELSEIHHTIGNHQKLKFLNLKGCTSLQCLPQCISMTSLEIFILSGCSKLQKFPESWENMDTLSELHLDGTAFREVPSSIQPLKGLVLLNLNDCKDLRGLPSILCGSLTSLKFLYLSRCLSLETLPDNIDCLIHLEELDACNTALRELPESISLLKNLKLLSFRGCSGLQLPSKLSGLSSLTTLNLGGCNLPEGAIPDDIGGLKSLKSLDLSENNFVTISESICHLSALTEISLFKCSKLRSLPKDIPSSLRYINLNGCSVLTNFSSSWARYSRPEDDESWEGLMLHPFFKRSGEEKLLAVARHIAKTLGHKDNMANDILQIFSNFDGIFSREKMVDDDRRNSAALELTLKSLERQISQYVAADQPIRSDSADSAAFLDAVDNLISTVRDWTPMAEDKSVAACLIRAEDLMQQTMFRLEDEFRTLMESGGESLELSRAFRSRSNGNLSFNDDDIDEDDEEGAIGGDEDQEIPTAQPITDYIVIDALPSGTINDLHEIAKRMVVAGFGKECSHVYSRCRREFLGKSLSRLGLQKKLSIEEVQKMPWQDLEDEIERWIIAANISLLILFPSERRLVDRVFYGLSSAADLSFMEVCRGSTIQILNFTYAVAIGPRSLERLFKVLDVFETMRDLMPEFDLVFSNQYCLFQRNEAVTIWKRLGEAIRGIFFELEILISRDPSKTPVPGGGLHPITRYVMTYLRAACLSRQTLEQVFEENAGVPHHQNKVDDRASSSSMSVQMAWIMELLESNLEAKSNIYRDSALCYVFLLNNGRYIMQKVKDCELGSLLGNDWIRKHSAKVRQYRVNYRRNSWNKVFGVLKLDSSSLAANVAAKSMKEKLKLFNIYFDELCKSQTNWVIFDEVLRDKLRSSLTKLVLPAYQSFVGRFQNVPEIVRHDKYIKYEAEDIEARINGLFQGSRGSGGGRK